MYRSLVTRAEQMIVRQVCGEIEADLKSHFATVLSYVLSVVVHALKYTADLSPGPIQLNVSRMRPRYTQPFLDPLPFSPPISSCSDRPFRRRRLRSCTGASPPLSRSASSNARSSTVNGGVSPARTAGRSPPNALCGSRLVARRWLGPRGRSCRGWRCWKQADSCNWKVTVGTGLSMPHSARAATSNGRRSWLKLWTDVSLDERK